VSAPLPCDLHLDTPQGPGYLRSGMAKRSADSAPRVVFVDPPVTKRERYGTLAAAGAYVPALGLCSLAAVTRAHGCPTQIVDCAIQGLDHEAAARAVLESRPALVGITSTTSTFGSASRLARVIKAAAAPPLVMLGGVHVTALPEAVLSEHPEFDLAVVGEGEMVVGELVQHLQNGTSWLGLIGTAHRDGESRVALNPRPPLIEDLDSLPRPAWDLLPGFPQSYNLQAQSVARTPSASVCTSRGCPGRCTFCDRGVFGSRYRYHSAEYVLDVVRELHARFGVNDIQFEDDNFVLHRRRLLEICDLLQAEGGPVTWSCQTRIDTLQPDVLRRMKRAGCWMLLLGVESGSPDVLELMGKDCGPDQVRDAVETIHQAGLKCKGFFITGFLNETADSLRQTRRLIREVPFDDISLHYFVPFPGSKSNNMASRHGTLVQDWDRMNYYEPVFVPSGLTENDLVEHTRRAYRSFYLKPRTIWAYVGRVRGIGHLLYLVKSFLALIRYAVLPGAKGAQTEAGRSAAPAADHHLTLSR
jgi:anaerobic magnesium-protoporphyrin IX monomethyl ester cyclase